MKRYTLSEIMTPIPEVVQSHRPIWEAWRRMRINKCHHLPVMSGDKLVGVVSERDLFIASKANGNESVEVADAMQKKVECHYGDQCLSDALEKMMTSNSEIIIVKDRSNNLIGVFTSKDILHLLYDELG